MRLDQGGIHQCNQGGLFKAFVRLPKVVLVPRRVNTQICMMRQTQSTCNEAGDGRKCPTITMIKKDRYIFFHQEFPCHVEKPQTILVVDTVEAVIVKPVCRK